MKSDKPLISIIVPVYKVEKYLNRCVESILNQTYENLEIILVDDGSPDNCPKICDDFAKRDSRITVIHKKNGGLSDARNKGLMASHGEYIGFVDSDDYIDKKMYESLYKNLTNYSADISCCKLIRTNGNNVIVDKKKYNCEIKVYNQQQYMEKFFKIKSQECVYYACNKLYHRSVLELEQYPVSLTSEDVVGTYKALLKSKKIVEEDYPYYNYYYNENGITGKFSSKDFDLLKIWNMMIELSKSNEIYLRWAYFNKNRINYTLLMRMALNLSYKEIKSEYSKECDLLLKELKKHYKEMIKSSLPFSRKITMMMIIKNYRLFVFLCNSYRKVIK